MSVLWEAEKLWEKNRRILNSPLAKTMGKQLMLADTLSAKIGHCLWEFKNGGALQRKD